MKSHWHGKLNLGSQDAKALKNQANTWSYHLLPTVVRASCHLPCEAVGFREKDGVVGKEGKHL